MHPTAPGAILGRRGYSRSLCGLGDSFVIRASEPVGKQRRTQRQGQSRLSDSGSLDDLEALLAPSPPEPITKGRASMSDLDLDIPPEHISSFITHAERMLSTGRAKTAFGEEESTHWIHSGITTDEGVLPMVVVLVVRSIVGKRGGRIVRVFLTRVRPPEGEEVSEGGYDEQAPWPEAVAEAAWRAVVDGLRAAAEEVTKPPAVTKLMCGYLAFYGTRITGEYRADGWRLAAPRYPEDPAAPATIYSEQMVACQREVSGIDDLSVAQTFTSEMERLAILLSVFWGIRVKTTNRAEHRWVFEGIVDGQLVTHLRQLGFSEPGVVVPTEMPPVGTLPLGPTQEIDRLNHHYASETGGFKPPADAAGLLELFYEASRTDPVVAERFLAAAKAYQTARVISQITMTGSVAYLVVAAESLVEEQLPRCAECGSVKGISRAMRETVFRELPCLTEREDEVRRLLNEAYGIRSKHFHTGKFAGGELELWRGSDILQPPHQALSQVWRTVHAIVNALLVAWLVRRVTGTPWVRASRPIPAWQPPQMFAIRVRLGGPESPDATT